ncbi:uncharacterized protein [Primulina eburnea]|uniref:uncharacterized protein n=1 Tax=Primulina eburnea TaxID=1245227 RepID=UPI003C6C7A50
MTSFTVLDFPSLYNIILGRLDMNELRAVASICHQKIKFPVGARVGEVRRDQPFSRKCYVEAVRADQSKSRREGKKAKVDEVGRGVMKKGEVHFVAEEEQEAIEVGPVPTGVDRDLAPDIGASTEYSLGISPDEVSNVVSVPKSTEKWRMCVDFRDLNKACPKDHYPLPMIDQLVDSTSGFELLSFMDAYQRYHQISLAKNDRDKTNFITSGGTSGYIVMPFGLKNAGATYQRIMNRVFEKQQSRNVEVYVDDILDKSKEVANFIANLEQTFATLMNYEIKLNPAKCFFEVKSGKFLDFIVTDRGIEDLKIHLAELLVFVKTEPGEKLFVYLYTTEYAVSSVLIKEEGSDHISHALRGTELRYSEVEKIALALIVTAQKLRPYFLSHQIVVLTNIPLGRITTHSEVSGRMIKWTVESYKPRVAIKAKALSDFLSEMVQPDEEKVWRIFVDGASSVVGCGVGVLITQQMKGVYETKDDTMLKYLQLIQAQAEIFVGWSIEQIPREENGEADALAKMAASLSEVGTREVLHVSRFVLSSEEEILPVPEDSWMTPLIKFIISNELPKDKTRAQKIKRQALRFVLLNNILYRRSFQGPLLKCLSEGEVNYVLLEIHEGCCAEHLGGIYLARKTMLTSPATLMKPIWAYCPFDQSGMDIVGPFPIARVQKKFLLVAVDYFSKWVKDVPLAKINEYEVLNFCGRTLCAGLECPED